MLHLYLVRHGETEWNKQHRYQGHQDIPLNQKGLEQARQLARRLHTHNVDHVFCSDLQRAMQTAEILIGEREISIQPDARLREMNFGLLEGHTFDDALKRWPEMISKWVEDYNQPPAGGERLDDFARRVSGFHQELRQNFAEKSVLLVAHGGPLREMIRCVLESSGDSTALPANWRFELENASLTEFQIDEENIIINRLNDTGHLFYT